MNDKVKYLMQLLLLLILMFIMGFSLAWTIVKSRSITEVRTESFIRRDTIHHFLSVPFREVRVPVPAAVDTAAILQAFYTERAYRDSIPLQQGFIILHDTVYQNRLVGRMITSEQWVPPRRCKHTLSMGAHLSRELTALTAHYRHNRNSFGIGYDFRHKGILATYQRDIFSW